MKKLITLLFAALIAALPLTTAAQQKTIQKLLFGQNYLINPIWDSGENLWKEIWIGYTDGTKGSVPIEKGTIK